MTRREMLAMIADAFDIMGDDYSGGEDMAFNLAHPAGLGRYCAVTVAGEHHYAYPICDSLAEAKERAVANIGDSIYAEHPVCVVNLDTGKRYEPNFRRLPWKVAQ